MISSDTRIISTISLNPKIQYPMDQDMDVNSDAGSGSLAELEGVPMMEEQGEFDIPSNVPITNYSVPSIEERPSS